ARQQQADQDEPAPSYAVVQTPHKGLAHTTDERSKSGGQRDGPAAPAQFRTHGEHKDPKAGASSAGEDGHPEGGRHDEPAIVDPRAWCRVPHSCRSFTGNTCRPLSHQDLCRAHGIYLARPAVNHPTPVRKAESSVSKKGGILLANLHQSSRSTFSYESFPSFF